MSRTFVAGSRGSRLALRQAEIALETLRARRPSAVFDVSTIRTTGDASDASLAEIGGRGVFVAEIERALLAGDIDLAVHSLKDLPNAETAGLSIAAVLLREDPRDALVSRDGLALETLPPGATVGTGSPRRAAQIAHVRPDIAVRDIRGNVDTRIRKVEDGDYDAVVLAAAGLTRLGWLQRASQVLDTATMLPAVGQGVLAVQVRSDDTEALDLVRAVDHPATRLAVTAERAFERRLGAGMPAWGCNAAIAAYASVTSAEDVMLLRGLVGTPRGELLSDEVEGPAVGAEALGIALAERLIAQGAAELLGATA